MANLGKEKLGYVNQRMVRLHSLKSHRLPLYWNFRQKYKMLWNMSTQTEGWDYTKYTMNTQFAIINTKAAEILTNTPQYDFIALDDEAQRYKRVREIHWDYVWQVSQTDKEIYKIVFDALKYWVGCGKEIWVKNKRNVTIPHPKEDGTFEFEEKIVTDYEGCKLIRIPYHNWWANGVDADSMTEAAILTQYDRAKFFEEFGNNKLYSNISEDIIPKGRYWYVQEGSNALYIAWSPTATEPGQNHVENDNLVSVLEYYNKYKDEYLVFANGIWINAYNGKCMPNTNPSKEIPLVIFTDHYVEDDIYAMGEFDITGGSAALKDESRSLSIEVVKAQGGIITIDPESEFDENVMELGIRKYARVEKDAFGFFAPNINASSLQYLEQKVDEDIIIESGVDFRNQLATGNETAEKTKGRIDAAMKRTNLNLKYNAFTFFERLGRLRMANMEFYAENSQTVPVKGMNISSNGDVELLSGGYGLFTVAPKFFKGRFALYPRMDSLMGDSSESKKNKYLASLQLLMNMQDRETGKPLFDPKKLVEAGRGIIDDVIDLDKINEMSPTATSPEQMLSQMNAQAWSNNIPPSQDASGWIPAEQRSGRPVILPSQSAQ